MSNTLIYALITILAGMATINGGLAAKLQSPALAAVILFIALVLSLAYLLRTEVTPTKLYLSGTPWYF